MPSPTNYEAAVDEILDSVYAAGVTVTDLHYEGRSSGTITSDRLYEAKQALLHLMEKREVEAYERGRNSVRPISKGNKSYGAGA